MGAKCPSRPTIFNPYNLGIIINVGISPKNFLNFSFNPFDTVLKNVKAISSGSPTCTWTKSTPPKKLFFWSNPYKIEIMITSLIEMLELPNFGHMITSTILFTWVTWQNFVGDIMDRNYDVITFISKCLYSRRPREANFAGIIKIATMFIKTIFKESNKFKRIRDYVLKCNLYMYFLI